MSSSNLHNTMTNIIAAVIVMAYTAYVAFKAHNGNPVGNGDVVAGITAILAAVGFAVTGKRAIKFLLIPLIAGFGLAACAAPGGVSTSGQQTGQGLSRTVEVQGPYIETLEISSDGGGDAPYLFRRYANTIKHGEQEITSQPSAAGDPQGGDVLSGNPVDVAGPTGTITGDDTVNTGDNPDPAGGNEGDE